MPLNINKYTRTFTKIVNSDTYKYTQNCTDEMIHKLMPVICSFHNPQIIPLFSVVEVYGFEHTNKVCTKQVIHTFIFILELLVSKINYYWFRKYNDTRANTKKVTQMHSYNVLKYINNTSLLLTHTTT